MGNNDFSSNKQIQLVDNFQKLVTTSFNRVSNAICWQRNLEGDFEEIVAHLTLYDDITEIQPEELLALQLSDKGDLARKTILSDLQLLIDFGAQPVLNLLKCYERDEAFDFISTDVYSFHVDRSPIATDTFLCTYYGAASEIISNDEVEQKIHIPEIRQALRKLVHGSETDFEEFLMENFFDLHYSAKPSAVPVNLGVGNLCRLAVDHPTQYVLPCVHRAPFETDGKYRLLLIC